MPEVSGEPRHKKMVVEYQPSPQVFRRATHAAWRAQASFKILFLLIAALLAAITFALGIGARPADQLPVVASLLVGCALFYAYPLIAYFRRPEYRSKVRFEFGRDGFSYQRGAEHESLHWSAIRQISVGRNFYILNLPKRFQLAIPRSSFATGQEQHFRLLAATEGVPIRD